MCIYICFILIPMLNYNYNFIYLYKGYASYIHISRGYVKHKRLRTTALAYGEQNQQSHETKCLFADVLKVTFKSLLLIL
jgi:hypothetical protein